MPYKQFQKYMKEYKYVKLQEIYSLNNRRTSKEIIEITTTPARYQSTLDYFWTPLFVPKKATL